MDRERLYEQIEARVDAMVAAGAADEVRAADAAGASATARKALGFEQLLAGDVEGMKRATRRYARRQLTWLRKLPDVLALDATAQDADALGSRDTGRVHFEKWQALGNDYLVFQARALHAGGGQAPVRPALRAGRRRRPGAQRADRSPASSPGCASTTPTAARRS